jgi:hypothetical protein
MCNERLNIELESRLICHWQVEFIENARCATKTLRIIEVKSAKRAEW